MRTWSKLSIVAAVALAAWMLAPSSASALTGPHAIGGAPGGQICISCHAPHRVPSTLLLWNHTASAATYSWSDATATTGGTTLPTNIASWSGSTKQCLSCHDGTIQIGSIYVPSTTFNTNTVGTSAKVGPDLKGNHPVAVPYPYNNAKNTYNGQTTGAVLTLTDYVATPAGVKVFADAAAAGPNNRGIECASCHDPHDNTNGDYLRVSKTNSAICVACHDK